MSIPHLTERAYSTERHLRPPRCWSSSTGLAGEPQLHRRAGEKLPRSHSVDMGTTGYDAIYGAGRLYLDTVPTNVVPRITTQPLAQTIYQGHTATLSVVAAGSPTLSYQWYRGTASTTTSPVGTNSATFTTPVLSATTSYWVRISNGSGHVDSATATITAQTACLVFPYTATDTTTLINAINCANTMPTDDVINLTTNGIYTLATNQLAQIANAITSGTLTINGNGATITSNLSNLRFFDVLIGGNLTLNNLTLDNGHVVNDYAGALRNKGTLTINNSVISNSSATEAGAIYNTENGSLTINNSTLSHNTSGHVGAAILNDYNATLTVTNSTFTGNSGVTGSGIMNYGTATVTGSTFNGNTATTSDGGGISTDGGSLLLSNSTFNGNTAGGRGGAIALWLGSASITNSTFYGNSTTLNTGVGGGIFVNNTVGGGATLQLGSSIVAGNTATGAGPNIQGSFTSLGYNLIADTSGATITGTTTGNLLDAAASPLNLVALADNGGLTQTMALLSTSIALNAGDPNFVAPPNYDQRGVGFPRVSGGRIDIGAYEVNCTFSPNVIPAGDTTALIDAINCANNNGVGTNDVINLTNSTYTLTTVDNPTDSGNGRHVIAGERLSMTWQTQSSLPGSLRANRSTPIYFVGSPRFEWRNSYQKFKTGSGSSGKRVAIL